MQLRSWMKDSKYSVKAVADFLGVHRTYLHKIMQGSRKPSCHLMQKIIKLSIGQVTKQEELLEENQKERSKSRSGR